MGHAGKSLDRRVYLVTYGGEKGIKGGKKREGRKRGEREGEWAERQGAEVTSLGEKEKERECTQAGGGRISPSIGGRGGLGRGQGFSLKWTGYPSGRPGQQIITFPSNSLVLA